MLEGKYLQLLSHLLHNGQYKEDRTGTGTYSIFGEQYQGMVHSNSFPLLTTKKVHFKSVLVELLWFLRGDTNIEFLHDNNVTIWDEWADENGDLGPIYGSRWRNWDGIDQIQQLIETLKTNPDSRRMIINAWDVSRLDDMALPPCHMIFQCYSQVVNGQRYLHLKLYQRSADIFLGVPFNLASYSLLMMILARLTNHLPGRFIHTFGDVHLYANHTSQAEEQLSRGIKPNLAEVTIEPFNNIDELTVEHFTLHNYDPHPAIPAPVAV